MNKWVLLQPGEQPPTLEPGQFIYLAMAQGGILRVMYRFISNIKGDIAGYRVDDNQTPSATQCQNDIAAMLNCTNGPTTSASANRVGNRQTLGKLQLTHRPHQLRR